MSIEVFVHFFGETEQAGISRSAVRSLFPVVEDTSERDFWRVHYDDLNSCDVMVSSIPSDPESLASICVWRPCGDTRLWEALIQILEMGYIFLYWPDGPPMVASEAAFSSFPKELSDTLGPPEFVRTAEDILRLSQKT